MNAPWWTKIGAKLVLSRVPVPYDFWRRIGIFRQGAMDDPSYAFNVFRHHFDRIDFARKREGFVALELGPGDSVVSALIAVSHGARRTYLVDSGSYATTNMSVYHAASDYLRAQGLSSSLTNNDGFDDMLSKCGAVYLTTGLAGLREIPSASVDFIWSQAVLEHVRLHEFQELNRELRRIVRTDGVCTHAIDLADHLQEGLNNLRFSHDTWESDFFAHAGFYTNRLRYQSMLRHFEEAGFAVDVVRVKRWPQLPTPRTALHPQFSQLSDDELLIREFDVVLRPVQ